MSSLDVSELFGVKGKHALVTGGGSGIGESMATALVRNGAHVYIASRKESSLKAVAERLTKEGPGTCEYIVANIVNKKGCDALADEIKRRTDLLEILVNNSGATWGARLDQMPEDQGWDKLLGLNVKALYYVTVALIPLLQKNATNTNPGRVINISSVASLAAKADGGLSAPGHGAWTYHVSKAAANHLTSTLAATLGPKFITCNAILPGIFPSKMSAFGIKEHGDALRNAQPMKRFGTPEDIGGLCIFLCSRASAHINGALIPIDGGVYISGGGGGTEEKL